MDNGDDGNGIGSVVANNFAFAGCVGSGKEHTEGGDTDTASRWPFVDLNICFTRLVNATATATVDAEGAPPSAPLPLLAMPPPVSARASSNGQLFLLALLLCRYHYHLRDHRHCWRRGSIADRTTHNT